MSRKGLRPTRPGAKQYEWDHLYLLKYIKELATHGVFGLLVHSSLVARYGDIRKGKDVQYYRTTTNADGLGSSHVVTCGDDELRQYAEGDHGTNRYSIGILLINDLPDADINDPNRCAPIMVILAKANGHVCEQLASMLVQRYAFRIPIYLVPILIVRAYGGTNALNVPSIMTGGPPPGINCKDRNCVGLNPQHPMTLYGRLLHAQGLAVFEVDLVDVYKFVMKYYGLTNGCHESQEIWDGIKELIILGTHHKSLESCYSILAVCVSRVRIAFTAVNDRKLNGRILVAYDRDWCHDLLALRGHLSLIVDQIGLTKRIMDAIEDIMQQSCNAMQEHINKDGRPNAKASFEGSAMKDLWGHEGSRAARAVNANSDNFTLPYWSRRPLAIQFPLSKFTLHFIWCSRCGCKQHIWPWRLRCHAVLAFEIDLIEVTQMFNVQGDPNHVERNYGPRRLLTTWQGVTVGDLGQTFVRQAIARSAISGDPEDDPVFKERLSATRDALLVAQNVAAFAALVAPRVDLNIVPLGQGDLLDSGRSLPTLRDAFIGQLVGSDSVCSRG